MVDGLTTICSVPPRRTYEEWFKIFNIYYTTSRSLSKVIRIIMETYLELSVQARNQELFRSKEASWNKCTSINTTRDTGGPWGACTAPSFFCVTKRKKGNKGKKRKSFKVETIKRLSPKSKCYCFSHSRATKISDH